MVLAFAVLAIAFATLWPMPGPSHQWAFCLACGDRGTSDLLLNVALFMPLGAALALRGRAPSYASLFAALLSSAIELIQLHIPGRDPTVSDIAANSLGATLAALVVQRAHLWLFPGATVASWLSRGATGGATLICLATGLLLTPSFPASQYNGLWTPNLAHLEWYRGHVLSAAIGATRMGPGPIPPRDRVRELLQSRGYELRVRALAGPPPRSLAPLFGIFDDWQRDILLLAADHDELVFRVRMRATAWRLDRPDLRVSALQHVKPGDTVLVSVVAGGDRYSINGVERGFTVGHGWALLKYPEALPFKAALSALWIGALFVPAGFWLRTRMDGITAALGLLSGVVLVPTLTPLLRTPPPQWVAAGLGLLAGVALHVLFRPVSARLPRPA